MKPDGGPAFPRALSSTIYGDGSSEFAGEQDGMSLRDYFAAHATDEDVKHIMNNTIGVINGQHAKYIHADAMLEARKK